MAWSPSTLNKMPITNRKEDAHEAFKRLVAVVLDSSAPKISNIKMTTERMMCRSSYHTSSNKALEIVVLALSTPKIVVLRSNVWGTDVGDKHVRGPPFDGVRPYPCLSGFAGWPDRLGIFG